MFIFVWACLIQIAIVLLFLLVVFVFGKPGRMI